MSLEISFAKIDVALKNQPRENYRANRYVRSPVGVIARKKRFVKCTLQKQAPLIQVLGVQLNESADLFERHSLSKKCCRQVRQRIND